MGGDNKVANKNFLASKTFQGIIVMLLAYFLPKVGVSLGDAEMQSLAQAVLALLGAAWASYGRATASKGVSVLPRGGGDDGFTSLSAMILVLVFSGMLPLSMLAGGCALKQLDGPGKAASVAAEMSHTYDAAHAQYLAVYEVSGEEVRTVMRAKVAPVLNTAKRAVAAYEEAAAVYRDTGTEPPNLYDLLSAAQRALSDIAAIAATWAPKE